MRTWYTGLAAELSRSLGLASCVCRHLRNSGTRAAFLLANLARMNGPRLSGILRKATVPSELCCDSSAIAAERRARSAASVGVVWKLGHVLTQGGAHADAEAKRAFSALIDLIEAAWGERIEDASSAALISESCARAVLFAGGAISASVGIVPASCVEEEVGRVLDAANKVARTLSLFGSARGVFGQCLDWPHWGSGIGMSAGESGSSAVQALSPWVYSISVARRATAESMASAHSAMRGSEPAARGGPESSEPEVWLLEAVSEQAADLVASSDAGSIASRIVDTLGTSSDDAVLQGKLFELLGVECLDLIASVLEHRQLLLSAKSRLKKLLQGDGAGGRQSVGGILVQSSSDRKAAQAARKAARRGGGRSAGLGEARKGQAPTGSHAMGEAAQLANPMSVGLLAAGAFMPVGGLPEGATEVQGPKWREVHVPAPPAQVAEAGDLVPVSALDPFAQLAFRGMKSLNRLQSKVFPTAYNSGENMLVAAPTGAGKTNVAMLTVCREIGQHFTHGILQKSEFKIVYVAPMKALAAEVTAKFGKRLAPLGVTVKECTGDMQLTRREIENTQMLVVTPEKWDVMTRKSNEGSLVSTVKLLIIDEVHLLAEERGAVIESLVARTLRHVEASQSLVRLVGLSATLPNFEDVALFLRVNPSSGLFHFGSDARPVPLSQRFIGISEHKSAERSKLFALKTWETVREALKRDKQVMVFVHSRKKTATTANEIRELAQEEGALALLSPFTAPGDGGLTSDVPSEAQVKSDFSSLATAVGRSKNADLRTLFRFGLGVHHAGMLRSDRTLSETLFAKGAIRVLACTATLAWGVNLPAHTVVINGTQVYNAEKGGFTDLGVLDVQQIFGRAGRPQFDSEGEGVIITTYDKLPKYLGMLTNSIPIESAFTKALPDHLNAEVVAGTVTSVREAMAWLSYTYLYIRMLRNPLAYGIKWDEKAADPLLEGKRMALIHEAAKVLDDARMIRYDAKSGTLAATDLGRVASHFYLQHESIEVFNEKLGLDTAAGAASSARGVSHDMSEKAMLELVCSAQEFEQVRVRDEELGHLDRLREHARVDIAGDVANTQGKVNLLMQAYIAGARVTAFTLVSDTAYVVKSAGRVARGLFEIALKKGWAGLAEQLLNLCKALDRRVWWDSHPLRQVAAVHAHSTLSWSTLDKLEERGWAASPDNLKSMTPADAGALVGERHAGSKIVSLAQSLPQLDVDVSVQPITRGILRITCTVNPSFKWVDRLHGAVQGYWVWVEDGESETLYHHEYYLLHKKAAVGGEASTLAFTIPIKEPLPPQYWVRVMSDSWIGVGSSNEVSFQHLILPEAHPPHTPLMDLDPLPVTALANQAYQSLYPFTHFNPVQTQVFHVAYHTDHNMLVGAPTGSGKTATAEIALMRMFEVHPGTKCVYVAPLRALVRERLKDWRQKFGKLGKRLVELTGDVTPDMKALEAADILVATPEKWDSISRGWQRRGYVRQVGLVIIDEIHLLGEDRGPVLEVLVSRMRYISATSATKVRLIGLSTALANAKDLADWLGIERVGLFNFRPSVRPIPMEAHIQGYSGKHYCPRMATMNKPAYAAIKRHSPAKPVLIFVSSRRQTRLTALELITLCAADDNPRTFLHMDEEDAADLAATMKDSSLQHTLCFGIGVHHAGLCERDRNTVEELFVGGKIQVLVCTSTLAWGVNFPAHLVIIKGTEYFDGKLSRYVDFPITDVLQMMGRAGRPQFDTHGVAVIMVAEAKKNFYRKFLYEPFPVESHLHDVLHDHLNAEIAGGTIKCLGDAMDYLTWTYFFRRLVQNPAYYMLEDTAPEAVERHMHDLVASALNELADNGCIEIGEEGEDVLPVGASQSDTASRSIPLCASTLGCIASFYYLKHTTVGIVAERLERESALLSGPASRAMPALLKLLCDASEFDEVPVRHNEEHLNAQLAAAVPWQAATLRMQHAMDDPHVKAFLLLQAHMARLPLPIADYINDTRSVLDQAARVLNAMVDMAADGGHLIPALRLMVLNQALVQARMPDAPSLDQLPHCSVALRDALSRKFAPSATVLAWDRDLGKAGARPHSAGAAAGQLCLGELAAQKSVAVEKVAKGVRGLPHRSRQQFLAALSGVPLLDVQSKVVCGDSRGSALPDGSWVVPASCGDEDADPALTLRVSLRVANARTACATTNARAGKPSHIGWWLVVGAGTSQGKEAGASDELLALKRVRVPFNGRVSQHSLSLPLPASAGKCGVVLFVMCDALAGTDQQYHIALNATAPTALVPVHEKKMGPALPSDSDSSDDEGAASHWAGVAKVAEALTGSTAQ